MSGTNRLAAANAVVRALRTGEITAARVAARHLAAEATFVTAKHTFTGREAVLDRLSGEWAMGPVPSAGVWEVEDVHGAFLAKADFSGMGAAPAAYTLAFAFDDVLIQSITERATPGAPAKVTQGMTPAIRRRIDRALAETKPLVVSYVGDDGDASLSLRGSLQTYSDTQLCIWIRQPTGGLVSAIEAGRRVSFMYRDNATRTTLIGKGLGRIVTDGPTRRAIYEMTPEVEQRHDIAQAGAAALIDILSLRGTSPEGPLDIRTDSAPRAD